MRKTYNKLIRDKIPEIMHEHGVVFEIKKLDWERYQRALYEKLTEEVEEVKSSTGKEIMIELADVYEVLEAIMTLHGISEVDVKALQKERKTSRGGFSKRIELCWTETSE